MYVSLFQVTQNQTHTCPDERDTCRLSTDVAWAKNGQAIAAAVLEAVQEEAAASGHEQAAGEVTDAA